MKTIKVNPSDVKAGDKVMPPARELSLWIRRSCREKGLPEASMLLTVSDVIPSYKRDGRGEWTKIKANYTMEFSGGRNFDFLVLPNTKIVKEAI